MQFKGRPRGTFRDDARWNSSALAVEFTLDVTDDEGTRSVLCRVSQEALADISRRRGLDGAAALQCYRAHRDRVHDKIDTKLKLGGFEADGSIVIRSADLDG